MRTHLAFLFQLFPNPLPKEIKSSRSCQLRAELKPRSSGIYLDRGSERVAADTDPGATGM